MKIDEMIRIARVSRKNGSSTKKEQQEAIESARAANVTYFNYLRARMFLELTDDDTQRASNWLSEIEFGDFSDNCEALNILVYRMEAGNREEGLEGIRLLKKHINRRGDAKSIELLLPAIESITGVA